MPSLLSLALLTCFAPQTGAFGQEPDAGQESEHVVLSDQEQRDLAWAKFQLAVGAHFSKTLRIEREVSDARASWAQDMRVTFDEVVKGGDLREAERIFLALEEIQTGWPAYDSDEYRDLKKKWSFRSETAKDLTKKQWAIARRANRDTEEARDEWEKNLHELLQISFDRCGLEDLVDANRYSAWLDMPGPPAVTWPQGWEVLSESEAEDRGLWKPRLGGPGTTERRLTCRNIVGRTLKPFVIQADGAEIPREELIVGSPMGLMEGDALVLREESGSLAAVLVVGEEDAEILICDADPPTGVAQISFVFVVPEPPMVSYRPFPWDVKAVRKVREKLGRFCEGEDRTRWPTHFPSMGDYLVSLRGKELAELEESLDSLRFELVTELEDAFKVVMQGANEEALTEAQLIRDTIKLAIEFRGGEPRSQTHKASTMVKWMEAKRRAMTSQVAQNALQTFFQSLEALYGSDFPRETPFGKEERELREELVEELEGARCKSMQRGNLEEANRIHATIHVLEQATRLFEEFGLFIHFDPDVGLEKEKFRKTLKESDEIQSALDWLEAHQDDDGRWDADDFMKHDPASKCDGPGAQEHDVGVTGLALLAFLDCGETFESERGVVLRKGASWLVAHQNYETGLFEENLGHRYMYDQGVATTALCKILAVSGDPGLWGPCQKAINFISRARNPYGAWRYTSPPNGDQDTSVTGWMVFATKAAEDGGLKIDSSSYSGAWVWLDAITDKATGRVGYDVGRTRSSRVPRVNDRFPADRTECMTAVGLHSRILIGLDPETSPIMVKHVDLLLKSLPRRDSDGLSNDIGYWYHGTYAMFRMEGQYGKKYRENWNAWKKAIQEVMAGSQRMDGPSRGSWDSICPQGYVGGRVYSTALMTSTLATTFRTDTTFRKRKR